MDCARGGEWSRGAEAASCAPSCRASWQDAAICVPLLHRDAALQQEAADLTDDAGALTDQSLARRPAANGGFLVNLMGALRHQSVGLLR
jgi:hypothetical protein